MDGLGFDRHAEMVCMGNSRMLDACVMHGIGVLVTFCGRFMLFSFLLDFIPTQFFRFHWDVVVVYTSDTCLNIRR